LLREAEVDELEMAFCIQEYVFWFKVAVRDTLDIVEEFKN